MPLPSFPTLPATTWPHGDDAEPVIFPPILQADPYFRPRVNRTIARLELVGRACVGGYGIIDGLLVSAGAGLNVAITAGFSAFDGVIDFPANSTYGVPASQAAIYLWVKGDGTITHTLDGSVPATRCVYLGCATTNASAVTAISLDGVIQLIGGQMVRILTTAPVDSPPSWMRLWSIVGTALYYWDGSRHREWVESDYCPVWRKFTVSFSQFQDASTSKTVTLATFGNALVVHLAEARIATAFAGTSISALAIDIGKTGTPTAYITGRNGLSVGSDFGTTVAFEASGSGTSLVARAISTGANLSALSVGSLEVHVLVSRRR